MKTIRILTIVFSMLIIIGAGHGIGPLIIFEFSGMHELFFGEFQFNVTGSYDDRLPTFTVIIAIGQAILITTFFFDNTVQSRLTIVGCLIVLAAIFILTYDAWDMNLSMISLAFSSPAILSAGLLVIIGGKKIVRR